MNEYRTMNATERAMARARAKNSTNPAERVCAYATGSTFAAASFFIGFFLFMSFKLVHMVLHRIGQPRLITELTVGLIIGNMDFMTQLLQLVIPQLFSSLAEFGMSCYLLVLGLEMDPSILLKRPNREAIVAYTGILSTFIVTSAITPLIRLGKDQNSVGFIISLSVTLTGTSSPVLTRLITDLKISRSDIGRLVIGAGLHTDMITMLLISISLVFHPYSTKKDEHTKLQEGLQVVIMLIFLIILLSTVLPVFVNWINDRNPIGKPMIGSDLVIFVAVMMMLCNTGPTIVGYSPTMTSFLIGLSFPRKGRLSKMLVGKINQLMSYILFPLFFCWVGALANFSDLKSDTDKYIWIKLFFLYVVVTIGKVVGAILSGMLLGFHWHVAIAIGLFLNVKGHFHIFVAAYALQAGLVNTGTYIVLVFLAIMTIALIPLVVKFIIERARKRSPYRRMALQWLEPSSDLRMLLCIHGPQNVPAMINIMEVSSRGNKRPRIGVYVTDMIEINDCNSTIFVPDQQDDHILDDGATTMVDESVVNMREQITNAIVSCLEKSGEGMNVQRLLVISTFANMHQDLYNLAEAVQASLLILPFHRNQRKDGRMDGSHHGFRHVNRKVLRQAPCSVGILVDRGIGRIINKSNTSTVTLHVAVVFIGGKDDREALAYASHIAHHPAINLTAIRFLQDNYADKASSKAKRKTRVTNAMQEQETKLDDECFTEFYEKKVGHGKIEYLEKHVGNAKETVSTLKALEGQYALFIVGRAGRVNSILTAGMSDWEECPDLGPIGEILADSDFSLTASVLVIQQHSLDGLESEFTIMSI
ncbi:Cation/H+ exchanger [Macleaya cordata]|uniref:Cation/H+ exchanger n=1 Tax=Macleaya cordata TaxID=56857 RepID=A0A200R9J7_MACCD|nr:Cation/H+ exchanger [Macleaya cordata]